VASVIVFCADKVVAVKSKITIPYMLRICFISICFQLVNRRTKLVNKLRNKKAGRNLIISRPLFVFLTENFNVCFSAALLSSAFVAPAFAPAALAIWILS